MAADRFRVVVSDQVFPSVEIERDLLAGIDASLEISDGTRQGLLTSARDADAILNTYQPIDGSMMAELRRCRIIARYGIGVDNIELPAAVARGIVVTNVPDYSVEEVAIHALALILAVVRRIPAADARVRAGGWGLTGLRPIHRVSTMSFGLVGYGRIGRRVAAGIQAFGGRLLVFDPYLAAAPEGVRLVDLEELVASSDVISIHAPLTPETRGLFDAARLAAMREGSYLVNTSRGGLVVLADLGDALRSGHLAGAALDVFDPEPPAGDVVTSIPNLVATPHMAYYSEESLQESQRKAATQVVKVLTGQTPDYPVR